MARRKRTMTKTESEPVLLAFIVGVIPVVASFVLGILHASGTAVPTWVIALLAGIGTLTNAIAAVWARAQVAPTAKFRQDTRE
jgi:hypothetical protein